MWEWAFLEDKTVDDIVRRQLAEMPDWVSKAVRTGDSGALAGRDDMRVLKVFSPSLFSGAPQDYTVPTSTMVDFELDGDDSQGVWTLVRRAFNQAIAGGCRFATHSP